LLTILFALVVLCVLPTSVLFAPHLIEIFEYVSEAVRSRIRRRRSMPGNNRRTRREFGRLDRVMNQAVAELPKRPAGLPIERIAADLRRLVREKHDESRSLSWQAILQRVYDDRLRDACRQLEVEEYLSGLSGVDLEIERVRVEDALRDAGMALERARSEKRPDHC
jgi:hypothetical protein